MSSAPKMKRLIKNTPFLLAILLTVNVLFMAFFCAQKHVLFIDEALSYHHANHTSTNEDVSTCVSRPSVLKNLFIVAPNQKFHYSEIHDRLTVHPPLFYYILHTVNSFFPNNFSKWTGLSLNLVLFLFTQFFLYLLSRQFLSAEKSLGVVLFYGFSVGAICTVVFIRNYMLLTLLTTILLFFGIKSLNAQEKSQKYLLFGFCPTLFLGCATHYYFFITAFIFCAGICLIHLVKKEYKKMYLFLISSLASVGLCLLAFPMIKHHLLSSGRASQIFPTLKRNIIRAEYDLSPWDDFISQDFLASFPIKYLTVALTFIGVIVLIYRLVKRQSVDARIVLIFSTLVSSVFLISAVMPLDIRAMHTAQRYFFHIAPLFALSVIWLTDKMFSKRKYGYIIYMSFIVIILFLTLQKADLKIYLIKSPALEASFVNRLKDKTLYIKWVNNNKQEWLMLRGAQYSFEAQNAMIFKDWSDSCVQNISEKKNAAIITPYPRYKYCKKIKNYTLYFYDSLICAYLPKTETE